MVDAADLAIAERLDPLGRLEPKQRAFCIHYSRSSNATQAAIQAGYSRNGASVTGSRLLQKDYIREALNELWVSQAIAAGITPERVATEVAILAFDKSGNVQHRDRLKAMELLSRYLGMFNDRITVDVNDPDILEAAAKYGVDPNDLVSEMAQLAPIDTDS